MKEEKMKRWEWEWENKSKEKRKRQEKNTVELMWIEPATSATSAIPAILAIHPVPTYQHLSRSKNTWLDSYPILFYETSSWRNAYCSCALNFWKYANMWICEYVNMRICEYANMWICEYGNMKYRNMTEWRRKRWEWGNKKKEQTRLSWCESNPRPLSSLPSLLPLPHITSNPILSNHIQSNPSLPTFITLKILGSVHIPFCYLKHLHDGMHTVHVRYIFENMRICEYGKMKYKNMIGW
jgi:hypothetical protein